MLRITLCFFLLSSFCCAQEKPDYFEEKVDIIENQFEGILKNNEYVIYGTPYKMHMIVKRKDGIFDFIFSGNYDDDLKIKDIKLINDPAVKEIFKKRNYEKGFIDLNSPFYKTNPIETMAGLPTYFSYNTDFRERYCEYLLSVGIKPVPMNLETYRLLSSILLEIPELAEGTQKKKPEPKIKRKKEDR